MGEGQQGMADSEAETSVDASSEEALGMAEAETSVDASSEEAPAPAVAAEGATRTKLFATFESDVARVGKPAPVAHLVDRIQADIAKLRDAYDKSRGDLETNVVSLGQRKEAVCKKLDEFGALTKEVIGGSMMCQKSVRERFATIKGSLDEREKDVIAHVKQLEEESLQTLQNTASELRAAQNVLASVIEDASKLVEDTPMMDFLNQYGPVEDQMDALLRHELELEVSVPVRFEIELEVDKLCSELQMSEITRVKDEPDDAANGRHKIES